MTRKADWVTVALYFPEVWILWYFQTFLFQFNPSRRISHYLTCCGRVHWLHTITGGLMSIGRWNEERDHMLAIVRKKVAERGQKHFARSITASKV